MLTAEAYLTTTVWGFTKIFSTNMFSYHTTFDTIDSVVLLEITTLHCGKRNVKMQYWFSFFPDFETLTFTLALNNAFLRSKISSRCRTSYTPITRKTVVWTQCGSPIWHMVTMTVRPHFFLIKSVYNSSGNNEGHFGKTKNVSFCPPNYCLLFLIADMTVLIDLFHMLKLKKKAKTNHIFQVYMSKLDVNGKNKIMQWSIYNKKKNLFVRPMF